MSIVQYKYNATMAQTETQMVMLDTLAWAVGKYTKIAIVSSFDKHAKYPQKPDGIKKKPKTEEEQAIQTFNTLESWRKSIVSKKSAAAK